MELLSILIQLALVFCFIFYCGFFVTRFMHMPLIGVYIIAGIVTNLHFNVLSSILPDVSLSHDAYDTMGHIGILLLMFTAGLEVDLIKLSTTSRFSIFVTIIQLFLTWGILNIIFLFYHWELSISQCLIICTLSSTVSAIQGLNFSKSLGSTYGLNALSILILQDVLLGPLQTLMKMSDLSQIYTVLLKAFLTIGVLFAAVFIFSYPNTHKKYKQHHSELYVIEPLAYCFLLSTIFLSIGLSPECGAFVAGIFLAWEYDAHLIIHNIQYIQQLFLIAFFAHIGLCIDAEFLALHSIEILLLLFGLLAIRTLVFFIPIFFLTRELKGSIASASLLAPFSEFTFLLIDKASLTQVSFDMINIILALSLAIGFIWHRALLKTYKYYCV